MEAKGAAALLQSLPGSELFGAILDGNVAETVSALLPLEYHEPGQTNQSGMEAGGQRQVGEAGSGTGGWGQREGRRGGRAACFSFWKT